MDEESLRLRLGLGQHKTARLNTDRVSNLVFGGEIVPSALLVHNTQLFA